jgi:hypothetical protein
MRFKGGWEQSTQKPCGQWGGINMRIHADGQHHLMEEELLGPTDKISRLTFQPQRWNKNSRKLKHHSKWRGLALPTSFENDNSDTDIKSDLTTSSSQRIRNWHYCSCIMTKSWIPRYIGLPSLSNGYLHTFIRSMVQEICFIEVDECYWNSVLDRLEGADYFEFFTKIWNDISWNFQYQTCRRLSQVSDEYLCVSCRQTEQWLRPLEDSTRQIFRWKSKNRLSFWRWKKIWFENKTTITDWRKQ